MRKSVTATELEALKERIINIVSKDLNTLLSTIDGRKVKTVTGEKVLKTANVNVVREEMSLRHKILNKLQIRMSPMLMLLGFYGLFFELTNPGSILPGVIGGICLYLHSMHSRHCLRTMPAFS